MLFVKKPTLLRVHLAIIPFLIRVHRMNCLVTIPQDVLGVRETFSHVLRVKETLVLVITVMAVHSVNVVKVR